MTLLIGDSIFKVINGRGLGTRWMSESGVKLSSLELERLIGLLQQRGFSVHYCTICPKQACDVHGYNSEIPTIGQKTGSKIIDFNSSFIYGRGKRVQHFYNKDGKHLIKVLWLWDPKR